MRLISVRLCLPVLLCVALFISTIVATPEPARSSPLPEHPSGLQPLIAGAQPDDGLDRTPTSRFEAMSKLLERDDYALCNLLLRLGMYSPAYELLDRLSDDKTLNDAARVMVLLRAAALFEAVGSHSEVIETCENLLPQMIAIDDPDLRRECLLTVYTVLAQAGRHSARPDVVRRYLPKALEQAAASTTASSRLAAFTLKSFAYELELAKKSEIDPAEYLANHDAIWKAWADVPLDAKLPPLEMRWAADAMRFWLEAGIRLQAQVGKQHSSHAAVDKRLEDDITKLVERAEKAEDLELLVGVVDGALACVPELLSAGDVDQARELLQDVEPHVKEATKSLQDALKGSPLANQDSSVSRLECRFLVEKARLLTQAVAAPSSADAQQAVQLLERACKLLENGSDAMAYIEACNDHVALLIRFRPAGWESRAKVSHEQALEFSRKVSYRPGLILALTNQGEMKAVAGDRPGAIQDLTAAVGSIEAYIGEVGAGGGAAERIRQRSRRAYELLTRLQLEAGQPQQALETLSRSQAAQTTVTLGSASLAARTPKLRGALERAGEAQQRNAALEDELARQRALPANRQDPGRITRVTKLLAENKSAFFQALAEIRAQDPDYERLLAVRPVNFAAVQKSIPANTVLVQYFPSADKLYIFVVTSDTFRIRTVQVPRTEIERLVGEFRNGVARYARMPKTGTFSWKDDGSPGWQRTIAPLRTTLVALHEILVDPIEEDLRNKEVVTFIPTGSLFYMPMQALARGKADGTLEFLVERRQVAVLAKSSDIMQVARPSVKSNGTLVAFGNPDMSLPAAQVEAVELARLFPGAQVYVQGQATKQRLMGLPANVAYLHLATHGVLDATNPTRSYVVFAGKEEEGRLRVPEIFALPLQGSRIVTLSACQTGLAERDPGSEISSLAEAFSIAGTPTVVASLWSVDDQSTRDLMLAFYQGLREGQSVSRALQQAQVRVLKDPTHGHPFYWAPFILLGDWR